jgi:hypothetical protein
MNLGKKIMAGVIAMTIGASAALPGLARADSDDWHHRDHHAWRWRHHDHDADDYYRGYRPYPYAPNYAYRHQYLPPNGEGMINRRNPNFYWACDSDGHHCHWARR